MATKSRGYNAEDIEILEDLSPILHRPGMYTDPQNPNHALVEIIDNSSDEGLAGFAKNVQVVLYEDGSASVEDDGRGIPVDIHPKKKGPVGARLALIEDVSGGNAFDEAHTAPWRMLRARHGDRIPAGCFSCTLEYRGQFDVDDATALQDAENLMGFLAAVGAVEGVAEPRFPDAVHLPLGGVAEVVAPQGGVVTWDVQPGADVTAGQVLGHVTDPVSRRRLPVQAPVTGMMFRTELWHSCLRGQGLAHVAGQIVVRSGDLLSP
jgi:hypothetical protein